MRCAWASELGTVRPSDRPSWFTPVSLMMHSMSSLSAKAWLNVLIMTAAKPSPRAYPSASLSHILDRPVGDSIDSLLCVSHCLYNGKDLVNATYLRFIDVFLGSQDKIYSRRNSKVDLAASQSLYSLMQGNQA